MLNMFRRAKRFVAEWSLRRRFTALIQTLRKDDPPIPYLATFEIPTDFSFPKDFKVTDFRGLLFCHATKGGRIDRLSSYWLDKESFNLFADRFNRKLNLPNPEFTGSTVDIKRREKAPWKPRDHFSGREWVLAVFALVGAGLGLRDYAAVLFAAPDVVLVYPDAGHANAVVGQEFTVPLTVSSEVRFAPASVNLRSASIRLKSGGPAIEVSLNPQILPNLAAGQSQSLAVSGSAPQRTPASLTPDIYDLSVTGDAKAGIIRKRRSLADTKRELWVWPAEPGAPHPTFSHVAANLCELDGVIYISKSYPQGLAAAFTLVAPVGRVRQMYISGASNSTQEPLRSDTDSVSTLKNEYQTPPLDRFQFYRYSATIYLTKEATQSECESLASNLTASLQSP